MNFYTLAAIYSALGGLGLGAFLWGTPGGDSLFDRLYRLLCQHLPSATRGALQSCCGRRAPAALDRLLGCGCCASSPAVQGLYLCVAAGCFGTFVAYVFPRLPTRFVGSVHMYVCFAGFFVCLAVWWKARRSRKWFFCFLFCHSVFCLYGFGLGAAVIYNVIVDKNLQNAVFVDTVKRKKLKASFSTIGQYMLAEESMIVFISLLSLIMSLVLFVFFVRHLSLAGNIAAGEDEKTEEQAQVKPRDKKKAKKS